MKFLCLGKCHAMKTHGEVDVSGRLYAPAASPQGKEPRYPFGRRLGGP